MSTVERWVMVHGDGTLIMVTENDGEAVAHRGVERREVPTSLSEIKHRYPRQYDDAVEAIRQVLVNRKRHLLRRNRQEIDVTKFLVPEELENYLILISREQRDSDEEKSFEQLCVLAENRYKTAVTELDNHLS